MNRWTDLHVFSDFCTEHISIHYKYFYMTGNLYNPLKMILYAVHVVEMFFFYDCESNHTVTLLFFLSFIIIIILFYLFLALLLLWGCMKNCYSSNSETSADALLQHIDWMIRVEYWSFKYLIFPVKSPEQCVGEWESLWKHCDVTQRDNHRAENEAYKQHLEHHGMKRKMCVTVIVHKKKNLLS